MNEKVLDKYADLIVKSGINVQKDQILVINSPIECAYFARKLAKAAYEKGAREVVVNWRDEQLTKIKYIHAPEEVLEEFPSWQKELYIGNVRRGAAFISIDASDPELMQDVDPKRIAKVHKTSSTALAEYREKLMANKNTWCVISIPTVAWAKKVFPDLEEEEALEALWNAILKTVRVDTEDPIGAWEAHQKHLQSRLDFLNAKGFRYLQYKNSLGTDLQVELPENHLWLGGADYTPEGVAFFANMPTEEVFTLPKKAGVNGTVVASMPLNYNGNLIENFSLTFQDGKITGFQAEKGYELLKNLIETDEGSCYLGEVALVPYDSPISNLKLLFYNTLFDENASCHLAIGKAYPVCLRGGEDLSKEELAATGANDSLVHEDFMIGTEDLSIIGITADGEEIPVFINGNFAL